MSGSRTKALKREFLKKFGRKPILSETKTKSVVGFYLNKLKEKKEWVFRHTEIIQKSEWRRFKKGLI